MDLQIAEVGGRDDLNRCNNALNQMVVDLDSSVLDREPAAAAVLRAPTSNDAGLNKPGLVVFLLLGGTSSILRTFWAEPVKKNHPVFLHEPKKRVTFLHEPKTSVFFLHN